MDPGRAGFGGDVRVGVAGDQNDRRADVEAMQPVRKLDPVNSRHLVIDDQAIRFSPGLATQQRRTVAERADVRIARFPAGNFSDLRTSKSSSMTRINGFRGGKPGSLSWAGVGWASVILAG